MLKRLVSLKIMPLINSHSKLYSNILAPAILAIMLAIPVIIVANIILGAFLGIWNWGPYWGVEEQEWVGFWATILSALIAVGGITAQLNHNDRLARKASRDAQDLEEQRFHLERQWREASALEGLIEVANMLSKIDSHLSQHRYEHDSEWIEARGNFVQKFTVWQMYCNVDSAIMSDLEKKLVTMLELVARGKPAFRKVSVPSGKNYLRQTYYVTAVTGTLVKATRIIHLNKQDKVEQISQLIIDINNLLDRPDLPKIFLDSMHGPSDNMWTDLIWSGEDNRTQRRSALIKDNSMVTRVGFGTTRYKKR